LDFLQNGFEFSPVNDIIYRGKKVSGSAQVRRGGMLLQHGTVLLEPDMDRMFSLLRVPEGKFRKHGLEKARARVGGVSDAIGGHVSAAEAADVIAKGLGAVFGLDAEPSPIPANVIEAALRIEPRYRSEKWNLRREK
jgi:lipoate-protein ligase A